jgi:hypothetical protein
MKIYRLVMKIIQGVILGCFLNGVNTMESKNQFQSSQFQDQSLSPNQKKIIFDNEKGRIIQDGMVQLVKTKIDGSSIAVGATTKESLMEYMEIHLKYQFKERQEKFPTEFFSTINQWKIGFDSNNKDALNYDRFLFAYIYFELINIDLANFSINFEIKGDEKNLELIFSNCVEKLIKKSLNIFTFLNVQVNGTTPLVLIDLKISELEKVINYYCYSIIKVNFDQIFFQTKESWNLFYHRKHSILRGPYDENFFQFVNNFVVDFYSKINIYNFQCYMLNDVMVKMLLEIHGIIKETYFISS